MHKSVLEGDKRALARLISMVENDDPAKTDILKELYHHAGRCYVLGITGAPGSGKSTLTDRLIGAARKEKFNVGVIAVDPSSPYTGGAILGDRIRMQDHALDPGVFIRSMGARGTLGGLSRATRETIEVMDASGRDLVLVETVGVGQSEVDIVKYADTTVLVLTPASGDSVQTIKAGVMEIADIFVVNKADLPGVERTMTELESMLDLAPSQDWRPAIIRVNSLTGEGFDEFWSVLLEHRRYLEKSGELQQVRRERARQILMDQVESLVKEEFWNRVREKVNFDDMVEELVNRRDDPYSIARQLLNSWITE